MAQENLPGASPLSTLPCPRCAVPAGGRRRRIPSPLKVDIVDESSRALPARSPVVPPPHAPDARSSVACSRSRASVARGLNAMVVNVADVTEAQRPPVRSCATPSGPHRTVHLRRRASEQQGRGGQGRDGAPLQALVASLTREDVHDHGAAGCRRRPRAGLASSWAERGTAESRSAQRPTPPSRRSPHPGSASARWESSLAAPEASCSGIDDRDGSTGHGDDARPVVAPRPPRKLVPADLLKDRS